MRWSNSSQFYNSVCFQDLVSERHLLSKVLIKVESWPLSFSGLLRRITSSARFLFDVDLLFLFMSHYDLLKV
jgi:hypothetical protein